MNLYIKYINNVITDHPMLEENLRQVFPDLDFNNLPADLKRFERVPAPGPSGPYIKVETHYELGSDDIVRDTYTEVPYTEEERQAKINDMLAYQPFPSWTFDETTCMWVPPIAYPVDEEIRYYWNEEQQNWIPMESKPEQP